MKKIIFGICCVVACIGTMNAQSSYKSFEWDILRLGYVLPSGEGVSGGLAISGEPRYNVNDMLSVGLRYEFALFGSDLEGDVEIGASSSYALMGDYYLKNDENNRLFAGLGIGTFKAGTVTVNNVEVDGESAIGVIPRVGYEFGHLRIAAEYNLLFKEGSSNYIGLHFGATLWGGYKG